MNSRANKNARRRVSEKIGVLISEGKPKEQAVAMAINMEKEHRLKRHGVYVYKR